MLVLSRQRDEEIVIGNERTAHVELSPLEEQALRHCTEPSLLDLAARLLGSMGEIRATCVDIRGDKVRLGVAAPRLVSVHRKEVYDAMKRGVSSQSGVAR